MRDLLKDVDFDGVVISGLPRTVETAEIVAEGETCRSAWNRSWRKSGARTR